MVYMVIWDGLSADRILERYNLFCYLHLHQIRRQIFI